MHMPGFPTKPNGPQTTVLGREKLTIRQTYFIVFGTETIFPILPWNQVWTCDWPIKCGHKWSMPLGGLAHRNLRHDPALLFSTTCQVYVDVLADLGNHVLIVAEPQDAGSLND